MPRGGKVKEIVKNAWSEQTITQAIHKIESVPGSSIRSVAKEYGLAESTLRFRMIKKRKGQGLLKTGRKCAFPTKVEANLAQCIGVVCNYGFSPSIKEVQEIVKEYVTLNKLDITQFKDGRPGDRWIHNFMKRNHLTIKRAEMISPARVSTTSNPFIIYDFYDTLEKIFDEYPELDATRIWNCDESGFPTDPSKGKVICEKGKRALKQRPGAGRENITVLAVCSASGVALDPLIIFKGKNMLASWCGDKALPNTFYGKSENGWMDTEVFAEWFDGFADRVMERPLLLLFDGHLTHISCSVIQRAINDQIIILKFPPHVTDVLQPLDVTCFGPLKRRWDRLLQERVNTFGATSSLTKSDFVNQLCKIWNEGMKPESIISGFSSTGIYPVDRTKYPTNRLNKVKLQAYERWKQTGVREGTVPDDDAQPGSSTAPDDDQPGPYTAPERQHSTPIHANPYIPVTKPWQEMSRDELLDLLGPQPCPAPEGMYWQPVCHWKLALESERRSKETSFEETFLKRIKAVNPKKLTTQAKIDFSSKVISHPEMLKKLTQLEEKKKAVEDRKEKRRLKKMEKEVEEQRKRKREESEEESESKDEDVADNEMKVEEASESEIEESESDDDDDPLAWMKNPPNEAKTVEGKWSSI